MPWAPGFTPVKADVHAQSVIGGHVERSGLLKPRSVSSASVGRRPASMSGSMTSKVAESHPKTTRRGAKAQEAGAVTSPGRGSVTGLKFGTRSKQKFLHFLLFWYRVCTYHR